MPDSCVCKSSIKTSTRCDCEKWSPTGELCKQTVWFELKVVLISVVCGLTNGYYAALLLVQTSQVLLAFMCFEWLWLHLLWHLVPPMCWEATDLHGCGLWSEVTFQGWNLGAFDTWDISWAVRSEAAFVQKALHDLDGIRFHESENNLGKQQMYWLNFNGLSCLQASRNQCQFLFSFLFLSELVSVLELLGADYPVARINAHTMQFPYSAHVTPCACTTGEIIAQLFTSSHCYLSVHINTRINPPPPQP